MMNKKLIPVLVVILAMTFLAVDAAAKVKFLSLTEFGIDVKAKNLYARRGNTAVGTVIDAGKARLAAGMTDARRGQQVAVTYLGDGFVEVKNAATGAAVTIEVKENVP